MIARDEDATHPPKVEELMTVLSSTSSIASVSAEATAIAAATAAAVTDIRRFSAFFLPGDVLGESPGAPTSLGLGARYP